ncbi:MAG TPA: hypothetical protein VGD71_25455 [Kribbella sp.]
MLRQTLAQLRLQRSAPVTGPLGDDGLAGHLNAFYLERRFADVEL